MARHLTSWRHSDDSQLFACLSLCPLIQMENQHSCLVVKSLSNRGDKPIIYWLDTTHFLQSIRPMDFDYYSWTEF